MLLVMLFLMCFHGAWAQLPPDIQADRHLMSAMKFIESEDYDSAKKEFESIIKLNIKVPNDFYFHYGKTLIKGRDFESGKKMIEKFIGLTGRSSEMYKPALELLSEAENPPPESAEKINKRLEEADLARKAEVSRNPDWPHSDTNTGKTFKAAGKEWQVGQYNINWKETRSWVRSLGGGWRIPTRAELKSLYSAVGRTSAIGWDWVWAEREDDDSSSAWGIFFTNGYEFSRSIGFRYYDCRAVAVR